MILLKAYLILCLLWAMFAGYKSYCLYGSIVKRFVNILVTGNKCNNPNPWKKMLKYSLLSISNV